MGSKDAGRVCLLLCCVFSGLSDEPITRRAAVCLIMCDLETLTVRRPRPELGGVIQ